MMRFIIHVLASIFMLTAFACTKKTASPATNKPDCGTPGWPQGIWLIKCVVSGTASPDSVSFDINGGQTRFGSYYKKSFHYPGLPLSDSTIFCGDLHSDINVVVYSADTTKQFTCSVYTGNMLIRQITAHTAPNSTYCFRTGASCD